MRQASQGFAPTLIIGLVLMATLAGISFGIWWVARTGSLLPAGVEIVDVQPGIVTLTPPEPPPILSVPVTPLPVIPAPTSLALRVTPEASPVIAPPAPSHEQLASLPPLPRSSLKQGAAIDYTALPSLPSPRLVKPSALIDYAAPFDTADKRPRIAIIIGGLGLSSPATRAVIDRMPIAVTLAFAPIGENLQTWINDAHGKGHEIMMQFPAEQTVATNLARLDWLLEKFSGYVGITNYMASKQPFSSDEMRSIMVTIHEAGLLFVDSGVSPNVGLPTLAEGLEIPYIANNRFIDNEASRLAIDARLEELERVAKETGHAIGIGYPYPVTIERVVEWASRLPAKGLTLAPVSALLR